MAGGHAARRPGQHRRRPGREPAQPARGELHRGRRLRELPGGGVGRRERTRPRPRRHDHQWWCRRPEQPVHVREFLQDAGAVADRGLPALLRAGRRHAARRGRRDGRAQAPRRRPPGRQQDLRRDPRDRLVVGRPGRGDLRPGAGRAGQGGAGRLRRRRLRPGDGRARRGARHRHRRRGPHRGHRADRGVRRRRAHRRPLVRAGFGQVADRAHEVGGRRGRATQGRARPAPPHPATDDQGDGAERRSLARFQPLLPQHRLPPLGAPGGPPAAGLGVQLRLRWHQLPHRVGGGTRPRRRVPSGRRVRRVRRRPRPAASPAAGRRQRAGPVRRRHARADRRRAAGDRHLPTHRGDRAGEPARVRLPPPGPPRPGRGLRRAARHPDRPGRQPDRPAAAGAVHQPPWAALRGPELRGPDRRGPDRRRRHRHPARAAAGGGPAGVPLPRPGQPVRRDGHGRGAALPRRAGGLGPPRRPAFRRHTAARGGVPAADLRRGRARRPAEHADRRRMGAAGDRAALAGPARRPRRLRGPPTLRGRTQLR